MDDALDLLTRIEKVGLFNALEKGMFADVKRLKNGGKGLAGVIHKDRNYINPFIDLMKEANKL